MKAKIPQPIHESYKRHRREFAWQIILPVIVSVLIFIALIVLIYFATFQGSGDVARWAAVSTIWIVIPIMLALLVFLALLGVIIYYLGQLLNITPKYTGLAQDYVHLAASYIKRGAEMAVKPVLFLDGIGASIKALFGRK
jgi:hypothetical protein